VRAVWLRFTLKCSSVYAPGEVLLLGVFLIVAMGELAFSAPAIAFDEGPRRPNPELADSV